MKAVLEKIQPKREESFTVFRYRGRGFLCPYHHHPEVELTWITSGSGQRLIGDHLEAFEPGDLVLIGANLPHSYFHSPGFDEGPDGAGSTVLQFLPDFSDGWLSKAPECRTIVHLLQRSGRGLRVGRITAAKVFPTLERLVNASGPARMLGLLEALSILAQATDLTSLATLGFRPEFKTGQGQKIEQTHAWITKHFQEPVFLPELARMAHLTPSAFSRFFRRSTGRTLTRFVNELRVGHASQLLLETEQSVAEIAFACGFENLSNFNRRFRDLKAMAPREFRQRGRGIPSI